MSDFASGWLLVPAGLTHAVVRRRALFVLWLLVLSLFVIPEAPLIGMATAASPGSGKLVVRVTGLPAGQRPAVKVQGPGTRTGLKSHSVVLHLTRPGRYVITVRPVRISRGRGSVRAGARVFPTRRRIAVIIRRGKTATVAVRYGTIVNPGVQKLPAGLLSVLGDRRNPTKLVYRNKRSVPARGAILTAAPSSVLPYGLIAKVTASKRAGDKRVLSVRLVPVAAAVPEFSFSGSAVLKKGPGGVDRVARAARAAPRATCNGPLLFDVGAKLDEFTIRRASAKARPAQMSFTMAVRTTERLGPRVAVAGLSCSWNIGTLGPWQGFIPTPIPGVVIPVYATIPVSAAASVQGSLSAFKINVASTSVLDLDVGRTNRFAFRQEGSNVWVDGVLQLAGSAKISATLSLQMGVGNPKIGDLYVKAGFGPAATWKSGAGCDLDVALGALSVGVKIGPLKAGTPPWSPFGVHLWHGCDSVPPPAPPPPPPPPPPPVGGAGPSGVAIAVTGGTQHSCALRASGHVQCWGHNATGQLGIGRGISGHSSTPVAVSDITNATAIDAGEHSSCAVLITGRVSCWGENQHGQMGNGTTTTNYSPGPVTGIADATGVSVTFLRGCAVRASGRIACWGDNEGGQLGDGTTTSSLTPVLVSGISNATAVSVSPSHACAVLATGRVKCWGYGLLGNGPPSESPTPVEVSGITNATAIAAGLNNSCVVLMTGGVECWGFGHEGQLGNGTTTDSPTPGPVRGITNATAVSAAENNACALLTTGQIECWGYNGSGQLGNGTTTSSLTPVAVSDMTSATAMFLGQSHSCAVVSSGGVSCWGKNESFQLGNGNQHEQRLTPVSVGGIP